MSSFIGMSSNNLNVVVLSCCVILCCSCLILYKLTSQKIYYCNLFTPLTL